MLLSIRNDLDSLTLESYIRESNKNNQNNLNQYLEDVF